MIRCNHCGTNNLDGSEYCDECGTKLMCEIGEEGKGERGRPDVTPKFI